MSARGPPPDWLSFLAALRPAHNDRADRPILRWQGCRGQVNVKCSADILLAHRALPDASHPLHRRRPVAPPATPELLCLSVAVADEIRFACLCATLVVLRQSLTVAPRNLNGYNPCSMAKRVSIINFKGGVGKTTLAFHLGAGLARYHGGQRVLLIDMDHQSSLSIICLGSELWAKAVRREKTIDQIFRPFIGQRPQLPKANIVIKNPMNKKMSWINSYRTLDIVPASLALDDIEIELTASHHGNAIQSEWNKRTLLCRWLEETRLDSLYDYIIFDCPPATKIVSQNAIAASHGYIIPVVPEAVMERGAPHLHEMIKTGIDMRLKDLAAAARGEQRRIHVSKTDLVGLVITRIQTSRGYSGYTNDHTQHLKSLSRYWNDQLVEPYIVQGTGLSQALADGLPVYDLSHTQNVGGRNLHEKYQRLTLELKRRIDSL